MVTQPSRPHPPLQTSHHKEADSPSQPLGRWFADCYDEYWLINLNGALCHFLAAQKDTRAVPDILSLLSEVVLVCHWEEK